MFVFLIIGALAVLVAIQIAGRKELEKRKQGFVAKTFEDKIPQEYTLEEKRYARKIGIFLAGCLLILLILLIVLGRSGMYIIQLVLTFMVGGWFLLIKNKR